MANKTTPILPGLLEKCLDKEHLTGIRRVRNVLLKGVKSKWTSEREKGLLNSDRHLHVINNYTIILITLVHITDM